MLIYSQDRSQARQTPLTDLHCETSNYWKYLHCKQGKKKVQKNLVMRACSEDLSVVKNWESVWNFEIINLD